MTSRRRNRRAAAWVLVMERVLILATSAFVCVCVGVALAILAYSPGKHGVEATPAPVIHTERAVAPPVPPEKSFDDATAAAADYKPFFARLREKFPGDYAGAAQSFEARSRADGRAPSLEYDVSEAIRLLRKSHGAAVAKARPEVLARVFDAQLAMMRAVAKDDPHMCVGFLYGATAQDFERVAASQRPLIAEMALARLEAAIDGETRKIDRVTPTEAEVGALEAALAANGLDATEVDVLIGGTKPDPALDDARMCRAGQTYLETLRALPEETRARIYSLLLQQMARS
jgi:hypothetical protein